MDLRTQLIMAGAALFGLSAVVSNAASVKVYQIVGQVDSNWTVDYSTYYHGTSPPAPVFDTFGYPTTAWLSGTWVSSLSSTVNAVSSPGLDIGSSVATGTGSYTASISNSAFSFSGSGYAQTSLDTTSPQTVIAAEGVAALYAYLVVPTGAPVFMQTQGTIGVDGYSTAEFRVTEVFPSAPNINIFVAQSGSWNTLIPLDPGTYRIDYFASSTNYPAYPDTAGASPVYSDTTWPASFSALGTINVETTFVPEPAIVGTLVSGASIMLLRRRRASRSNAGGRLA